MQGSSIVVTLTLSKLGMTVLPPKGLEGKGQGVPASRSSWPIALEKGKEKRPSETLGQGKLKSGAVRASHGRANRVAGRTSPLGSCTLQLALIQY